MGFRIASRRFVISAAVSLCTFATVTSAPARAQPEPPPPVIPGYPIPQLIVPGNPGKPFFLQDFSQEFAPYTPPAQTDARGVFVATNANSDQTVVGMPGSRLGVVSPRIGPYAGSPGFQTQGFGPGVNGPLIVVANERGQQRRSARRRNARSRTSRRPSTTQRTSASGCMRAQPTPNATTPAPQ